ncbi:MAG: hypothetical protein JNM84_02285 [Planctomycetes bacterium]|nr:hypothetical protein [Planctomycetota bacterium]
MLTRLERRLRRLRRTIALALAVRASALAILLGGALVGALVLWARSRAALAPEWLIGGGIALALAAIVAGVCAARRTPPRERIAAWLELRSASGGAVLSACAFGEELADEASARRTAEVEEDLRFAWGASFARAAFGVALLAAGALWPLAPSEELAVERLLPALLQRAGERFAELEAEGALPEEERAALQQRLRELAARALANTDPTELLRALDDLDERLSEHAERARAAAERALAESRSEPTSEQLEALPAELRELAERALAKAPSEEGARELEEAHRRARELADGGAETPAQSEAAAALAEHLAEPLEEAQRDASRTDAGELAQNPGASGASASEGREGRDGEGHFGGESAERRGWFDAEDSPRSAAERSSGSNGGNSAFEEARAARLRRLAPSQRRAVESFFSGERSAERR